RFHSYTPVLVGASVLPLLATAILLLLGGPIRRVEFSREVQTGGRFTRQTGSGYGWSTRHRAGHLFATGKVRRFRGVLLSGKRRACFDDGGRHQASRSQSPRQAR